MNSIRLSSVVALALLSGSAQADLSAWVNAVAAGAPVSYTNTNVVMPTIVDIGSLSSGQGLTYEFVINGTDAGLSSALIGAKNTGFGSNSALKFEQYPDTGNYGITQWGVADWTFAPHATLVDLHLAFVVDTSNTSTELFVDGVSVGTVPHAPHITNRVGFGEWFDPNGSVDSFTGTMYGTAIYEAMLAPAELQAHSNAFHSTEPGLRYCFGDGSGTACPCGNAGGADEGCQNSAGSGSAMIAAGSASSATDDLFFSGSGLLPAQPALLFQGLNQVNGGLGNLLGDGLRCAGMGVVRMGVSVPDAAGNATWGPGLASVGGWTAGTTRRFQIWYRDPSGSPCGSGFNLSNGYQVTFQP